MLLYPNGQLSAEPEIRDVNYTTLQGQLSKGDSGLVVSGGIRRTLTSNYLIGEFNDFRGGISYRRGLTEDITVGVGVVGDESILGLGEVLYQPAGLPLKIGFSSLLGSKNENSRIFNADIDLNFQQTFRLRMLVNEDVQSFNLSSGLIPNINFRAGGNSRDNTLSAGINFNQSFPNFSLSTGVDVDSNNNLRWSVRSRYKRIQANLRANENNFNTELIYYFSRSSSTGHSVILDYETRSNNNDNDYLASLNWRYISKAKYRDGRNLWDVRLGYGIGSQGDGIIASASTPIIPGLNVELVYEQISLNSNESRFRLQLRPNFNIQSQIAPADFSSNRLRSEGGMLIQPFFDLNGNGRRDRGEEVYTDDPELLLLINNKTINSLRPFITNQGIFIRLDPQTYRLDLDPAGYPLDWSPTENAYAVDVIAGVYTPVTIPLNISYTVAGKVTDTNGNPLRGATVEAIPITGEGKKVLSITNSAGIFYLEQLTQGTYNLFINQQPAEPSTLELNQNSEPFFELNLLYIN